MFALSAALNGLLNAGGAGTNDAVKVGCMAVLHHPPSPVVLTFTLSAMRILLLDSKRLESALPAPHEE